MIGYSDSNKDVGYVASGWADLSGPGRASPTCSRRHGVRLDLLPRPRRRGRPRRRADQRGDHRAAARHRRRAPEDDRAGRGPHHQVFRTEIAHRELELAASATCRRSRTPRASLRAPEGVLEEMAALGTPYRRSSTTTPTSSRFFVAVTPLRRSRGCAWARARPGAAPMAASTICERSRGCSRGRSRGSFCPPGSASGPRWRRRARRTAWGPARDGERVAVLLDPVSNAEMACAKADRGIAAATSSSGTRRRRASASGRLLAAEFGARPGELLASAARIACSTATRAAGLDRPAQPVRGPAVVRADRAVGRLRPRSDARRPRGAAPREPADDQRHRQRAAQHRLRTTAGLLQRAPVDDRAEAVRRRQRAGDVDPWA